MVSPANGATERGFIGVNGARLYCEVAGHGPALVLLHDGITDSGQWDAQFGEFARHYRTVRYDLRGYGQSLLPDGPFSPVADLAELLGRLGLVRVALVGCGMGGRVALDFCLTYPERVTALVLEGPGLSGYAWSEAMLPYLMSMDAALAAGNVNEAVEADLRMWVDGPDRLPDQVDPAVRDRVREMTAQTYAAAEGDGTPEPTVPPAITRLTEIRAPLLIVLGEYDGPDMRRIADRLEVLIAGARQVVLPGAGHFANMEQPPAFNALVLHFLAEALSGDSGPPDDGRWTIDGSAEDWPDDQ